MKELFLSPLPFRISRSLSGLALLLLLASCGGETSQDQNQAERSDDKECGPGTILQDRQCVLAPFECPEGEVVLPTGRCASPEVFCGSGALYDSALEACVPSNEVSCGEGTIEVDGRCIVEGSMTCGNGTVLADGQCRLSTSVCGSGTQFEDNQCLPDSGACHSRTVFDVITGECTDPAMVVCGEDTLEVNNACVPMVSFVDELAAEADFDFLDPNRTIAPGDQIGDQIIFTGTINAGSLFHTFPITGVEGRWIKITLYPRGVPSLGFRVRQAASTWERRVLPGLQSVPSRSILLPADGNFDLVIETTLSTATGGPYGDPSWSYVGVVEVIEAPEARQWDFFNDSISGDLRNREDNFLEIELPPGTRAVITPDQFGVDVTNPTLEIWESPASFLERYALTEDSAITLDSGANFETYYLLFDAREFTGSRSHFAASALQTTNLLPGAFHSEEIAAQKGQLIYLSHATANSTSLAVRVLKEGSTLYSNESVLANNRSSYTSQESRRDVFLVPEDGIYTVEYQNTSTSTINGFFTNLSARNLPTLEIDDQETANFTTSVNTRLETGDWRYLAINSESVARIEGRIQANGSGNPDATLFDADRNVVRTFTASGTTELLSFTLENPGAYLLMIRPNTALTTGFNLEVDVESLSTFNPGDSITETFTASTFDIFTANISYLSGDGPDLRVYNPDGEILVERLDLASGTTLMEPLPGPGEYTFEITHNGSTPLIALESSFQVDTPVQAMDKTDDFSESFTNSSSLEAGFREFHLLRARAIFEHSITASVFDDGENAEDLTLRIWNLSGPTNIDQASGAGEVRLNRILNSGLYLLEVLADSDLQNGYHIQWNAEISTVFDVSVSSFPDVLIPDNIPAGIDDVILIPSCPTITAIDMDIDIQHGWRGDLIVKLTSPEGAARVLKSRFGGSISNILGNFNQTLGASSGAAASEPAVPISEFEGENGSGAWTLNVSDNDALITGSLKSWTLNLSCED